MIAYLDYNATAPLRPEARTAMLAALQEGAANPSSVHQLGRKARGELEAARKTTLSSLCKLAPDFDVTNAVAVFTSGATEALNWVVSGLSDHRLLISSIEHEAALTAADTLGTAQARRIRVTASGRLDLNDLASALAEDTGDNRPCVLILMAVNNETGVVQPVSEAFELCRSYGARLICDCVQAVGKTDLNSILPYADLAVFSSHKIGGPHGVGAVVFQPVLGGLLMPNALISGGGQERGQRAGTENLAAIIGFAAAMEAVATYDLIERRRIFALRSRLEAGLEKALESMGGVIHGRDVPRAAGTVCISRIGRTSAVQLMKLDLAGVCASSGSACSSGKVARSHVLIAMRASQAELDSAIRFSLGWASTETDVAACLDAFLDA